MSKKLFLLLISCIFLGVNLNLNSIPTDEGFINDSKTENVTSRKWNPFNMFQAKRPTLGSAEANLAQEMAEKIMNNMEKLNQLMALLMKYNNNLTSVKNDPKFKEIKPVLKEVYSTISSLPFLLSMSNLGIRSAKANIKKSLAKEANIKGFEDINQDVQNFADNIFAFTDKFIEFLKSFSNHFTQNKMIQELIAD